MNARAQLQTTSMRYRGHAPTRLATRSVASAPGRDAIASSVHTLFFRPVALNKGLLTMVEWLEAHAPGFIWDCQLGSPSEPGIYIYVRIPDDDTATTLIEQASHVTLDILESSGEFVVLVPVVEQSDAMG